MNRSRCIKFTQVIDPLTILSTSIVDLVKSQTIFMNQRVIVKKVVVVGIGKEVRLLEFIQIPYREKVIKGVEVETSLSLTTRSATKQYTR